MVSLLDISLDEFMIQLKSSTTATLGQKKVAIVERFREGSMYGLSAKKCCLCRGVAVSGGSTVLFLKHFRYLFLLRVVANFSK